MAQRRDMVFVEDNNPREPEATIDDLYRQNESIIGHLERLNENLFFIRQAVYGQTRDETEARWEEPKHGEWGAIADASAQAGNYLSTMDQTLGEIKRSGALK